METEPHPEPLQVMGLDEPPTLNPGAARALLRLLVNVARARGGCAREEDDERQEAA